MLTKKKLQNQIDSLNYFVGTDRNPCSLWDKINDLKDENAYLSMKISKIEAYLKIELVKKEAELKYKKIKE